MLKKFNTGTRFVKGTPVYVVTKKGEILEGYEIESTLLDLVSLNRSPLDGTEKQGFTIDGDLLKPNWCDGKKFLIAACVDRQVAEEIANQARTKIRKRS